MPRMDELRQLPSIDQLLNTSPANEWPGVYGRPLVVEALRSTLEEIRADHQPGADLPGLPQIFMAAQQRLDFLVQPTLFPVINATGVILHTNLGRAPLSQEALHAVNTAAAGYTNLEFDLEHGTRGSRLAHAEQILTRLTGAQAAIVVNNNAAAVLLALSALTNRRRVIISRTQLVEIGGGFRIPDVMRQSGARLVEVGTTNRVHLADYEEALQEPAAAILRVHHSNYKIIGFSSEPDLVELGNLARSAGVLLIDDLGSGALLDTAVYGLIHEPTVQESLAAGADLVCFSGDKLLGGPQAGIIAGRQDLIQKIKKHPLARVVRADKLCLAALAATLLHYLKDEAVQKIPSWRMITTPVEEIRRRAVGWSEVLQSGEVLEGQSTIGGGSLPEEMLPTCLLALDVPRPNQFLQRLRRQPVPVIARIDEKRVLFDPRTVMPEQDGQLLKSLSEILKLK